MRFIPTATTWAKISLPLLKARVKGRTGVINHHRHPNPLLVCSHQKIRWTREKRHTADSCFELAASHEHSPAQFTVGFIYPSVSVVVVKNEIHPNCSPWAKIFHSTTKLLKCRRGVINRKHTKTHCWYIHMKKSGGPEPKGILRTPVSRLLALIIAVQQSLLWDPMGLYTQGFPK